MAVFLQAEGTQQAALKVVVIEGANAVNIIQQKTAVAPVVEVRDQNDLPVAGVPVTFSISGGKTAAFASGSQTLTVTTNTAGRAIATGLNPLTSGTVQINVTATLQGQTAAASILQTNYATLQAAQAAGASGSGSGGASASGAGAGAGGGGFPLMTVGIIGGAAAGAAVALKQAGILGEPLTEAPVINGVQAFPESAFQGITTVDFNFTGEVAGKQGTSWSQAWDFGDGTSQTVQIRDGEPGPRVTHMYNSAGTFTVRLTITNYQGTQTSGQTTVVVNSMTGRWRLGSTNNFYDFVQTGSTFTGTFTAPPTRTINGVVQATAPFVSFTETQILNGVPSTTTFTSTVSPGANQIIGAFNSGGVSTSAALTRQ